VSYFYTLNFYFISGSTKGTPSKTWNLISVYDDGCYLYFCILCRPSLSAKLEIILFFDLPRTESCTLKKYVAFVQANYRNTWTFVIFCNICRNICNTCKLQGCSDSLRQQASLEFHSNKATMYKLDNTERIFKILNHVLNYILQLWDTRTIVLFCLSAFVYWDYLNLNVLVQF